MSTFSSLRIAGAAAEVGAGWSLLSTPEGVAYASGHVVPIETGPSPFAGGPTVALVGPRGEVGAVTSNLESAEAAATGVESITSYVGFSALEPEDYLQNYLSALTAHLDEQAVDGRVAVESASLPWPVVRLLESRGLTVVDASPQFARARMVKSPQQLALLRESARCAALAQRVAMQAAEVGMSELQLFSLIRGAVEVEAGERVAFAGDLLSGIDRTSGVAGWATNRRIGDGDMIIADLAPRIAGFWSDSCNTFVVGHASAELARMHGLARRALDAGVARAQPGVPVSEVDRAIRSVLSAAGFEYPHHSGHSIGTSVHEFPRIIPGEATPLEPGMVILLEPGLYRRGVGGVRLEWMFEVGEDGLECLTDFDFRLEPH